MKLFSVVFKSNGKNYYFNGDDELVKGDYVIVETEKGEQYAQISKVQSEEFDLEKCKELIKKLELNMHVISADFAFDKSQLLFCFVSDERVDFRLLAKKLAAIYHTRIELRQIGARDKAKEIGGVGICGQKICCRRFLNHIDAISMNMAKNQNLALNPSKINGLCGRLLCCLQYEDENYIEAAKELPAVGDTIKTNSGEGIVTSVDILNKRCKVLVGSNKEEVEFK